jgi:hypothetical protein
MESFPYAVGGIMCIVGLGLGSGGIGAIRKAKAAAAERRIAAFASGKELAVHYDPEDPKRALLDVTAAGSGWLIGLASLIVLVGALVLVGAAAIARLFAAFREP